MLTFINSLAHYIHVQHTFVFSDHITSPSALVLPIKDIIQVCKEHDVLTMIDGAHAIGQLNLNLRELGADFYTGDDS